MGQFLQDGKNDCFVLFFLSQKVHPPCYISFKISKYLLEFQPHGLDLATGARVTEIPTNIDQSSNRWNSSPR